MPSLISEDNIEQAVLQTLQAQYGYTLLNCFTTKAEDLNDGSNRSDKRDVILRDRLKAAATRLNPDLPEAAIDKGLDVLTQKRLAMSAIACSKEISSVLFSFSLFSCLCFVFNKY